MCDHHLRSSAIVPALQVNGVVSVCCPVGIITHGQRSLVVGVCSKAADGAIGLETMLAAALRLHHDGSVKLSRLIDAMSTAPARIFGLDGGTLKPGARADITLIDLDEPWVVSKELLVSKSKNSPFEDARFSGRAVATFIAGKQVYSR